MNNDDGIIRIRTTVGEQLRKQSDEKSDGHWEVFGQEVVFLAAEYAFVFDAKEFTAAMTLPMTVADDSDDDAFQILLAHCKDIADTRRGERAVKKMARILGWTPVYKDGVR